MARSKVWHDPLGGPEEAAAQARAEQEAKPTNADRRIIGHAHHSSCLCGCQRAQGRVGTLVENGDTAALEELGLAIYHFAEEWPYSAKEICFPINDAGREFLGLVG